MDHSRTQAMSLQLLTPREHEIVASLCGGNSNKMIARELGGPHAVARLRQNPAT
jgi:DNA-binding NarL/FixJ family response regulator